MRLRTPDPHGTIRAPGEKRGRVDLFLILLSLVAFLACRTETIAAPKQQGQLDGDLELLERRLSRQNNSPRSNVYFDLISLGRLSTLSSSLGLTNNRTLFVDTHGTALPRFRGGTYVMYAGSAGTGWDKRGGLFTVKDLAAVLGTGRSADIHNIFISGCNVEGRLQPQEFRRHFPNATNIMHQPAGQLSFSPMLLQTLALHSQDIHPLYSRAARDFSPTLRYELFMQPERDTRRLSGYVADLYRPGSKKPYLQVAAGRERFDPSWKVGGQPLPPPDDRRGSIDPIRRLLDLELAQP